MVDAFHPAQNAAIPVKAKPSMNPPYLSLLTLRLLFKVQATIVCMCLCVSVNP